MFPSAQPHRGPAKKHFYRNFSRCQVQQVNSIRSYTDTSHPSPLITSLCRALGKSYFFVAISKIYVFLHVPSDTQNITGYFSRVSVVVFFSFSSQNGYESHTKSLIRTNSNQGFWSWRWLFLVFPCFSCRSCSNLSAVPGKSSVVVFYDLNFPRPPS